MRDFIVQTAKALHTVSMLNKVPLLKKYQHVEYIILDELIRFSIQ